MNKRGRLKLHDDTFYKREGNLFQTDSKRNIENNLFKARAMVALSDYVTKVNDIPHFDYILDSKAAKKGKFTFTYKQTVFIELGRLFDFLIDKEGYNPAVEFLVTYTTSLCEYAYKNKMSVREMEQEIRAKKKEVKQIYK